jgi:hypothetical protein
MSNFMKIRPVGAELFHVDRPTDMKKIFVILRTRLKEGLLISIMALTHKTLLYKRSDAFQLTTLVHYNRG